MRWRESGRRVDAEIDVDVGAWADCCAAARSVEDTLREGGTKRLGGASRVGFGFVASCSAMLVMGKLRDFGIVVSHVMISRALHPLRGQWCAMVRA